MNGHKDGLGIIEMWEIPRRVIITSGVGEGSTPLNSFDKALLDAGIGNLNLVRVSSVVPPDAEVLELNKIAPLKIALGALVPAIYTFMTTDNVGERIAAAIAVGKPRAADKNGMVFEACILGDAATARDAAERMVRESLEARDLKVHSMVTTSSELVVSNGVGCVIAAALMLP